MENLLLTGASGYVGKNFIKFYNNNYNIETFSLQNTSINTLNLSNINTIIHMAALVHQKIQHSYTEYYNVNVKYPVDLAKMAKENGVRQFLFMSTIAVYGDKNSKLDEDSICNPITFYGKTKLEAEKQLLELNDENFLVSIIRAPMVYGKDAPGNIDSLVSLIKKVPILPLGAIYNKRTFIYIGNLCNTLNSIIQKQKSGIFLSSDDNSLSTSNLINLISKELDKKVYLLNIPLFPWFLKTIKPSFYKRLYESLEVDNIQTKKALSLHNPYSVEDGIKQMINGENS